MKSVQILMMNKKIDDILGYGYLYNYYAISNGKFAPSGWKVPSSSEFSTLLVYLGGYNSTTHLKLKSNNKKYWQDDYIGNNLSNFSAVGAGIRSIGLFTGEKISIWFHRSDFTTDPGYMILGNISNSMLYFNDSQEQLGLSVRLLYSGTETPASIFTDADGNNYDVIQIGDQYWMKQNWKCTKLRDGTLIPNVTDQTTWDSLTTMARCAYNNDESKVNY